MNASARLPLAAMALAALCASLLSGCAAIHRMTHREPAPGCHERPFTGDADTRPPLKVPQGLSAPDTTGSVKVPPLSGAEAPRGKNDPCLDMPPSYGTEPTGAPPPRRPPG